MPFMLTDTDIIARRMAHAFPWSHHSAVHVSMAIARRQRQQAAVPDDIQMHGVTKLPEPAVRYTNWSSTFGLLLTCLTDVSQDFT